MNNPKFPWMDYQQQIPRTKVTFYRRTNNILPLYTDRGFFPDVYQQVKLPDMCTGCKDKCTNC